MKICPECKYERTIQDDLLYPDYECPSCGIIFEKEKAQKALAALEKERELERNAKREKLKKEEARKKKAEEERQRQEEEARKKKEEEERLRKEAEERQRQEEEAKKKKAEEERQRQEEEARKKKEEEEKLRKEKEAKQLLEKRQEKINNFARKNADKVITSEDATNEYQLFDMCPFVIAQTGKGLGIAGIGDKKNKGQHLRCIQKYCRLWTLKIDDNGKVYAQGCSMQFQGLSKEEIAKNFAIKNTQILEEGHPLDDESKDANVKK